MNLLPSDYITLNDSILSLHKELGSKRHTEVMLQTLNQLVPADSIVLNILDLRTNNYSVVTLPNGIAKPDEVELVGRYLKQSPFPAYYVATGDSNWKMTTDFMPIEDFHATDLWRLGLSRWGINQQICGMLAVESDKVHALTINRTHQGFDERERNLLNALHPHLVTSYVNALAFSKVKQQNAELRAVMDLAPGAYGCLKSDGSLAWMQPKAREWLGNFFASEAFAENGLPVSFEQARMSSIRPNKVLHAEKELNNQILFLCLSPSPFGGSILRLECRALSPKLTFRSLSGVSPRENEVLQWMIEGKRNREIADILCISERTVEKHVASIITKFSVENRASAIIHAIEQMTTNKITV